MPKPVRRLASVLGVGAVLLITSAGTALADGCMVTSAGPATGKSWAEKRQEIAARVDVLAPGAAPLSTTSVSRKAKSRSCGALAAANEVKFRLGLIAPTWQKYRHLITAAAQRHNVPAELILATIVDESGGNPTAVAKNPGYVNDAATPSKVSFGLSQMLLSTARIIMPERRMDRAAMFDPATAIELVARYHARFYRDTGYDPRLVAWTYVSGTAPRLNPGQRWYPRNLRHASRYTAVFEASIAHLSNQPTRPTVSFAAVFAAE